MSGGTRTDWFWIREAPVQGQEQRYYGQLDVAGAPVNPLIAARLGRLLPAAALWMGTPLSRTRSTALALKPGVDPIEVGDFNDQNFGLWQGRGHNDVYATNRTLDWNNPASIKPPEGESFAELNARVATAVERLTAHYAGHSIVAVAHASTIRAAIGAALGLEPETALRIDVAAFSLTRLTARLVDGALVWSVGCINLEVRSA